jgi:MYXO-CTERM domain-containing protein
MNPFAPHLEVSMLSRHRFVSCVFLASSSWAALAAAGIPECRNIRLEDALAGECRLEAEGSCQGSCSRLGIYKKACATQLHSVCREDCTLAANPTCSDECTVSCTSECDRGVSITCIHNCFGECVGSCSASCDGASDPAQCRATCEATCDGECDIQCRPVVDGDCYVHCVECCGGSCKAQANMDCQTTCQDEEFEDCEHELEVECSGSCDVDAALFCNGEYVLAGDDLQTCVQALIAKGTLEASAAAEVQLGSGSVDASQAKAGCASAPGGTQSPSGLGWFSLAALAGLAGWARRRRASHRRGDGVDLVD